MGVVATNVASIVTTELKLEDAKTHYRMVKMPASSQDYWILESIKDKKFEDKYDLGRELGRGATAVVYKCTLKGTDQAWAVKIMDKRVEHRTIVTEVGILLKMDHPNIVRMK